jgi:hypothetical protein
MKKKLFLSLLLGVASYLPIDAQNTIESIRKEYQAVHEMMDLMTPDEDGNYAMPPEYFDLRVVQNLPATGPHHENIRMYYGDLPPKYEGDPYPPHFLRFATAKYNFAAREFYEEYLYDNKGRVMFIYAITPDVVHDGKMVPYELRMWFDGKRLLRFTANRAENLKNFDNNLSNLTFREEYAGKTIPEKYKNEADRCKERANRFLVMFKGIDDNTYL